MSLIEKSVSTGTFRACANFNASTIDGTMWPFSIALMDLRRQPASSARSAGSSRAGRAGPSAWCAGALPCEGQRFRINKLAQERCRHPTRQSPHHQHQRLRRRQPGNRTGEQGLRQQDHHQAIAVSPARLCRRSSSFNNGLIAAPCGSARTPLCDQAQHANSNGDNNGQKAGKPRRQRRSLSTRKDIENERSGTQGQSTASTRTPGRGAKISPRLLFQKRIWMT